MINKRTVLIFCWFILTGDLQTNNQSSILDIASNYQLTFDMFKDLLQQDNSAQVSMMPQFFLQLGLMYQPMAHQVQKDLKIVTKAIKTLKKQGSSYDREVVLKEQLSMLRRYIKKHRLQYEVVWFHQDVQNRWHTLFEAINLSQDVATMLSKVNIEESGVAGLKILMKKVEKDFRKIDTYEYRLHTDWIDAKLANYVLKIELIRLRNAILFHPLYKKTDLKLASAYPR